MIAVPENLGYWVKQRCRPQHLYFTTSNAPEITTVRISNFITVHVFKALGFPTFPSSVKDGQLLWITGLTRHIVECWYKFVRMLLLELGQRIDPVTRIIACRQSPLPQTKTNRGVTCPALCLTIRGSSGRQVTRWMPQTVQSKLLLYSNGYCSCSIMAFVAVQ
jgi:hypothetical protein